KATTTTGGAGDVGRNDGSCAECRRDRPAHGVRRARPARATGRRPGDRRAPKRCSRATNGCSHEGGEDAMNPQQERKLDALVDAVKGQAPALSAIVGKLALLIDRVSLPGPATTTPAKDGPVPRREYAAEETMDNESLYQSFKSRLIAELESDPRVMDIVVSRPELRVKVQRHVVEVDGDTLEGRLALLIHEGFFDQAKTSGNAFAEVTTRGFKTAHPNVSRELDNLARKGFVRRSNKWYTAVPDMKRSIVEADA